MIVSIFLMPYSKFLIKCITSYSSFSFFTFYYSMTLSLISILVFFSVFSLSFCIFLIFNFSFSIFLLNTSIIASSFFFLRATWSSRGPALMVNIVSDYFWACWLSREAKSFCLVSIYYFLSRLINIDELSRLAVIYDFRRAILWCSLSI